MKSKQIVKARLIIMKVSDKTTTPEDRIANLSGLRNALSKSKHKVHKHIAKLAEA